MSMQRAPHITREGYRHLQDELSSLWSRRAGVTRALAAAAAEGDRSENAEYIYRKKELREIDRRIRYLQRRLPSLKIVDQPAASHTQIFFGVWVTLVDEQGRENRYRLVGTDEHDAEPTYISIDSPLARALLGRFLDDAVTVDTPSGQRCYIVTAIDQGG